MFISYIAMNRMLEKRAAEDEETRRLIKRNGKCTLADGRILCMTRQAEAKKPPACASRSPPSKRSNHRDLNGFQTTRREIAAERLVSPRGPR